MRKPPGNDLVLANLPGRGKSLGLSPSQREKHLYICGGTGTGKSKFLEHLIRQDIRNWKDSKCGLLVLDPHGSLYDGLINWLAWTEYDRPIIPIDLRQDDWIVSYNLLRQRETTDPSVLIDNITDAIAYVWGQSGTQQTPLFERWVGNILRPLYDNNLTLVQAEDLFDQVAKEIRTSLTAKSKDKFLVQDWRLADKLSPKDFDAQIASTKNRLQRFLRNQLLRLMFGQPNVSLDLGKAIEEGAIILVSLATERSKISKQNAELFATLLLNDLWTAAQDRGKEKTTKPKPFYVYIDEFQRFVSPTISENLDQARGYGLHLTLAHQFPNQLLNRGENGKLVFDSVMETASSKVVFRLQHEENLRILAHWLFMGVMNPDEIKHELWSTKVMGYREETRTAYGTSKSSGYGSGSQYGNASGSGSGGTNVFDEGGTFTGSSRSWSDFASGSDSHSSSYSDSDTTSEVSAPMLVPIIGQEVSHVQFRSLEEQIFRAMATLFDQDERHCVGRMVGMKAPVSLYIPEVARKPGGAERAREFLEKCYKKLGFALTSAEAKKQISERAESFAETLFKKVTDEPTTAKRPFPKP